MENNNNDTALKQQFDNFVNDYNNIGKAIDEISPLFNNYMNAIGDEKTLVANIEKYCGFLKIEAENSAAKNDEESNIFKKSLMDTTAKLKDIVNVLNECKSGINLSQQSLTDIANEFKNNINAHLTNINSAINKTNPFLQGYVDSVGVKQEVVIPEETKDEVNTEDANVSKVISIEPAEKEILTKVQADDKNEIPTKVQTDSLDELTNALDDEMQQNSANISDLTNTVDTYNADKIENDNIEASPFDFNNLNISESKLDKPVDDVQKVEEEAQQQKPNIDDDRFDLEDFFNQASDVKEEDDSLNTSVDDVEQKVVSVEDFVKKDDDTFNNAEKDEGFGRSLSKVA